MFFATFFFGSFYFGLSFFHVSFLACRCFRVLPLELLPEFELELLLLPLEFEAGQYEVHQLFRCDVAAFIIHILLGFNIGLKLLVGNRFISFEEVDHKIVA